MRSDIINHFCSESMPSKRFISQVTPIHPIGCRVTNVANILSQFNLKHSISDHNEGDKDGARDGAIVTRG